MAEAKRQFPELVTWLKENRYSDEDVEKILERVRQYDQRIGLDTVMESIASGAFDLNAADPMSKTMVCPFLASKANASTSRV